MWPRPVPAWEVSFEGRCDREADDPAGKHISDECDIGGAGPGARLGDVDDPKSAPYVGDEAAPNKTFGFHPRRSGLVVDTRLLRLTSRKPNDRMIRLA